MNVPHHNVKEELEHKTEGMQTGKGEVLPNYVFV